MELSLHLAPLVHLVLDEADGLVVLHFLLLQLPPLFLQLSEVLLSRRDVDQVLLELSLPQRQVGVEVVVVLGHLGVLAETVPDFFEKLISVLVSLDRRFFLSPGVECVHFLVSLFLDVFGLRHASVPSS